MFQEQVERLAKVRKPGNLKLQTANRKPQFAVSREKPDAKGLCCLINNVQIISRKMGHWGQIRTVIQS